MADSARMRRGEPVSAAELAPVEGSSDLVPQEHMSQAQLMQLQAMDELEQQADEFWNVTSITRCRLRTCTWCVCCCWSYPR